MKNSTFIFLEEHSKKHIVFSHPGSYLVFFHNISGDLVFNIKSKKVDLDIIGLYTGSRNDNFKVTTTQFHQVASSRSNLFIKGVFNDKAVFNYQGLIRIEKKAHGSYAYQKNQNILLSPNVFISSKPDLEILANDVFCTHGSTTGMINKEEKYYLETRGINEEKAEKLLISGFIREVFDTMSEKGYKNESEQMKKKLINLYD